MTAYQA